MFCTCSVFNVRFKILSVSSHASEYHIGCFCTYGTICHGADCFSSSLQKFDGLHILLSVNIKDIIDDMLQLSQTYPARNTFSAALRMTKSQEGSGQVNRTLSRRTCNDSSLKVFVQAFYCFLSGITRFNI